MSDEMNKEPKDGAELDSTDLEQVTGGAAGLNFTDFETIKKKNPGSGGNITQASWDIEANKPS